MPNVTFIGNGSFGDCSSLESVYAPNLVTVGQYPHSSYVGNGGPFHGCSSLVSIDLPNVTYLSDEAFLGCSSLTSVFLPKVE